MYQAASLLGVDEATLRIMMARHGIQADQSMRQQTVTDSLQKHYQTRPKVEQVKRSMSGTPTPAEIEAALRETGYTQSEAAKRFGVTKSTMGRWIQRFNIPIDERTRFATRSALLSNLSQSRPPEAKARTAKIQAENARSQWANASPEQRAVHAESVSRSHKNRTEEEREEYLENVRRGAREYREGQTEEDRKRRGELIKQGHARNKGK